jgi:hypothetical protein
VKHKLGKNTPFKQKEIILKNVFINEKRRYICSPNPDSYREAGTIAQLVEQRTENPCVAGSIPAGTTTKAFNSIVRGFFHYRGTVEGTGSVYCCFLFSYLFD